ncbi:hypothetical protein ACUOA5_39090, partial [Escherichia coli]
LQPQQHQPLQVHQLQQLCQRQQERHSICKLIFTPRPSRCAYRLLPDRTTITRRHRRSAYVPAVADIIVAADAPATVDAVEAAVPAVAKAPAVPAIVDGLVILIFLLQIE